MTNIPINLSSGKILITGGSGFIGQHVIKKLLKMGFEIIVLDRMKFNSSPDYEFIHGDIRDKNIIKKYSKKVNGIINLAGILGTSETIDNPRGTISSNIIGALNIFNSAKNYDIPVVHITVGNYWMNNPYAITKHAAENIALHFNDKYKTQITVVRGLNAYGEGQKDFPVRKLMPNLILPALKNSEILIYGDGNQIMDMIYVEDLAEVLVRGLTLHHNSWDRVIEAGSGIKTTVNDICKVVLNQINSKSKVSHIPMRGGEPNNAIVLGDPSTMLPLGIQHDSLTPLEAGINRSIRYYKANL